VSAGDRSSGREWWRDAVIYQVYVRSFADGNGDGIGDLPGVRDRLAYIHDLGVDAIWLNPFYPSPQADGGYDVSDYRDVDPRFGTLADFDLLLAEAHELDLRVLVDLVPNHTSDQHPWFRTALASPPGSPARARFLFRDGAGPDGDEPPNDWTSVFGGPAWTRVAEADGTPGQWYLHLFAPEQPDLDWTNPEVRAEFEDILRFWLTRGVDGFRIDVAHGLAKDLALPDLAGRFPVTGPAPAGHPFWDRDEVHEIFRQWRRVADEFDGDRTFVAEAWVLTSEQLARYVRPDELHTAFDFNFLLAPWDAAALRAEIDRSIATLAGVDAPTTWVLSNHDTVREVTRYGDGEIGQRRARAAALLMLALPGGAYIYQGEELGLPEVIDLPDELRQDPTFLRTGGAERGRDGSRVPLPWSGDEPPFGFGTGTPWLPQPADWASRTAAAQAEDDRSMLSLYRKALQIRRRLEASGDRPFAWVSAATQIAGAPLAFTRGPGFACVVNVGREAVPIPESLAPGADVLLASDPGATSRLLPPDATVWLELPDADTQGRVSADDIRSS
jgi:alpha-glucosidase